MPADYITKSLTLEVIDFSWLMLFGLNIYFRFLIQSNIFLTLFVVFTHHQWQVLEVNRDLHLSLFRVGYPFILYCLNVHS